ncbi:YdeI/OmpD-associated family protein [Arthrobacter sp. MDT1-65]
MSVAYDQVQVDSRGQWREWLTVHAAGSPGIWLVTWKKGAGPYLSYDDLVEEALCFGWIDSQPRTVDEDRSSRLVSPRHPGSNWSRVNKERVQRLTEAGLMTQAGLDAVRAAQADGSWTALDDVEDLIEPDALRAALDAHPSARAHWDDFPRSAKRAILEWISTARTDTTRERRIHQTVTEAADGRRANQWRQPKTAK